MDTYCTISQTVRWIINIVIPSIAGLVGIVIGAWLSTKLEKYRAKLDFCARQLREFYSPLLGLREEIRILCEFRGEVSKQGHDVWQELCALGQQVKDPEVMRKFLEPEVKHIEGEVEYNNRQLSERLIPAYKRMIQHFRENFWLADPETRKFFPDLVKFVEGWERFLSRTHSPEVMRRIDVNETKLLQFYRHLQDTHNALRERLRQGEPRN